MSTPPPVEKPTLFLSHAAKDSRSIVVLKDRLMALTGGAIDMFVSSDGQSVPFGRNWVYELEEALKRAKLMFVFLSPAALDSRWVSFESGFAYALGVHVVPVGISGVDLAAVGPPLGLLQGFNIRSAQTMNNLVSTINNTFGYTMREALTPQDYREIVLGDQMRSNSLFGEYSALVYEMVCPVQCILDPQSGQIESFLKSKGVEFHIEHGTLYSPGLAFSLHKGHVEVFSDPLLSAVKFHILEDLTPFMVGPSFDGRYSFSLHLVPSVRAIEGIHKQSARIYGSEINLASNGRVALGDLTLQIQQHYGSVVSSMDPPMLARGGPTSVEIGATYGNVHFREAPVADALKILFSVGVLFLASP